MNFDFGSIMQMMLASSLISGKGFDLGNMFGNLTFDKLLGLQMLGNMNFNNMFTAQNHVASPMSAEQFEQLKTLLQSK